MSIMTTLRGIVRKHELCAEGKKMTDDDRWEIMHETTTLAYTSSLFWQTGGDEPSFKPWLVYRWQE